MKSVEIRNARIRSTTLGVEDHGILTCFLNLEGDGWGCWFGGYSLDGPTHDGGEFAGRCGTDFGMEFIRRILETLEINGWEKLPGTVIRCKTEGWGGGVPAIGHALKEKWFEPSIDLAHLIGKDSQK